MAIVKLIGKFETANPEDCFMAINTSNVTFVTPGSVEQSHGVPYTQLFFPFIGNIESIGFSVPDTDAALEQLAVYGATQTHTRH